MKHLLQYLLLIAATVQFVSCSGPQPEEIGKAKPAPSIDSSVITITDTLLCGETALEVITVLKDSLPLLFVNLHEDESTSIETAARYVADSGGIFIRLRHKGTRLVDFTLSGKKFTFDPNRIFTALGRKNTLLKYGSTSPEAERAVENFAGKLTAKITGISLPVLAVHNNTPDNYSAASYLAEYKNDADSVWIAPGGDPDDFFFVISADAFTRFKQSGFSCVLQNNRTVTDDGSLSVYCGNAGIPYVNIEAEKNHAREQYLMLREAASWSLARLHEKTTLRKVTK